MKYWANANKKAIDKECLDADSPYISLCGSAVCYSVIEVQLTIVLRSDLNSGKTSESFNIFAIICGTIHSKKFICATK